MGHEALLAFAHDAASELDAILRAAPYFHRYDEAYASYEYRGAESLARDGGTDMPDASVSITPRGLALVVYGGPREIARDLVAYLEDRCRTRFGAAHWEG